MKDDTNASDWTVSSDIVINSVGSTNPTILSITSSKPSGSYTVGALIPISVEFSEPVRITGVPKITLETGATDAVANYSSGTGSSILVFDYIIQAGHSSSDLDVKSLNLSSEDTVKDVDGNNVSVVLPTDTTKTLAGVRDIIIDTTAPNTASKPVVPTQA